MNTGLQIAVSSDLEAGQVARRAIAASEPTLPPSVQGDVSLLLTELVANAVLHGGDGTDRPVQVGLQRHDDRIRVEVIDGGTAFEPSPVPPHADSVGGWGLVLVDRIAERWGVSPTQAGKCVWFELLASAEHRRSPVSV